MLPVDIFLRAIQSLAITGSTTPYAVWTSMWSVHGLCFGPRRAKQRPITRIDICAYLGHRVATGEPPRAMPRHAL
jgi:hypothetical protein